MAWNLSGRYVETCSCDLMCPCNLTFDHGATYDYCRVTLCFDIESGEIEGTDVGGLKFVAIADSPKVMTEGNWKLGAFVDANASEEQADKLVKVFTGQLGGPMAGLAPLIGEMLGVEDGHTVKFDGMFHPVAPDLTMAEAQRSQISAFGIEYEGKTGVSHANFSWAA